MRCGAVCRLAGGGAERTRRAFTICERPCCRASPVVDVVADGGLARDLPEIRQGLCAPGMWRDSAARALPFWRVGEWPESRSAPLPVAVVIMGTPPATDRARGPGKTAKAISNKRLSLGLSNLF